MTTPPDYYEVLQVSPNAEEEIIQAAYRRLAMKWHPDRRIGDPSASKQMELLLTAYEVISNPHKRQEYDNRRQFAKNARQAGEQRERAEEERKRGEDRQRQEAERQRQEQERQKRPPEAAQQNRDEPISAPLAAFNLAKAQKLFADLYSNPSTGRSSQAFNLAKAQKHFAGVAMELIRVFGPVPLIMLLWIMLVSMLVSFLGH